jgi:hypothetical protein
MYLADRVALCTTPLTVCLNETEWTMPGVAGFAERVSSCPVRYVLMEDVHEACCDLAERFGDLLQAHNPILRAPLDQAWIEWRDPETGAQVGVLMAAADDGRSGTLRIFWTRGDTIDVAQADIVFDFDRPLDFMQARGMPRYALRALPPAFAGLKRHLSLTLDPEWQDYFRNTVLGANGLPEASSLCGEMLWRDVIRTLAFFILVGSRAPLVERPVERARLNALRVKAGKPPLLDHVEMRIGQAGPAYTGHGGGAGGDGARKHPRLHMVRGHLVRRRDSVFWRAAHVRGGGSGEPPMPATRLVKLG